MNPNSIYVDRRLFPQVTELTILDARSIFESRLRDGAGPHTIRLDLFSVAWDGTSIFGTDKSYMIGRTLSPHKGATRLRHALGGHTEAFTHIVLDPQTPDVVALMGPSPVPKTTDPEFKLTGLEDLLAPTKFETLDGVTKASMAMLKFISVRNPNQIGATIVCLGNSWSIECVTTLGEAPTFFLREDPPPEEPQDEVPGKGWTVTEKILSDRSFVPETTQRSEGQNPEEVRDE